MKDLDSIFLAARDKTPEEREAFLASACGGDASLRERVAQLLNKAARANEFFGEPPQSDKSRETLQVELPDAPDEAVGQTLGRYKLLERVGEGGCGVVYVAEQTEPVRRRVALKVIKLGMDTKQVVARFEAERQALAMMDHPNIAKVLDAGTTETGRPFFVMELVRGIRITDYCDQNNLPTKERLDLFIKVCQAIQHAHQKGIIHRDIKPSNILVTLHDGVPVPKVIDFGIAKATEGRLTDATVYTQLHQFIGTPAYMSPEQAEMSGLDIDTRSDIYSLGVLLYELLAGSPPFDPKELMASGIDAMRRTIREEEPVRPSTRLATLSGKEQTTTAKRRGADVPRLIHQLQGDLDWIVMKALEKDRTHRYESANSFAQDIQRHLHNEPVVACPPSNLYRARKFVRRNKLAVTAASIVTAALVIGLGTAIWALVNGRKSFERVVAAEQEQRRERTNAEQARVTANLERDRAARLLSVSQAEQGVRLLEQGDPIGLLHLLEARKSVEHLPEERFRRTLLWSGWMNSLPKPEIRVMKAPSAVGAVGDYFSGQPLAPRVGRSWIVTGSTNGDLFLSEPGTGRPITRFSTGTRRVGSPELSANGRLLTVNAHGSFQLWDLAPVHSNQPPRRLLGRISRIAFDPQRQRVLTLANQGMPLPGDPPEQQPDPATASGYQLQIWDSTVEPYLITTWVGDRQDFSNHQFALSADGSKVVAGGPSLKLWDARTGQPALPALSTNAFGRARDMFDPFWFSPNGRWLLEVRRTACLRYDLSTGQLAGEPVKGLHRYQRPWLAGGGGHLVVSLTNGFQVLHLDRGQPMGPTIAVTDDNVRALALSADGLKLATSGPDRALRVWDTTTGRQAGPTLMPPAATSSASFTADGKSLEIVSSSIDFDTQGMSATSRSGPARIISLVTPPPTWVTNWAGVRVIGFRGDGELLTYTKSEGTMAWRHPATGRSSLSWSVPGSRDLIGSALNPEGTLVATAFKSSKKDSEIQIWETQSGRLLESSIIWTNQGALAFSPDGQTLAGLGGYDGSGSIQLWDVASRQPRAYLPSAPKEVSWLSLWFSPDGRFIAARNSYTISVWDITAGKLASGGEIDFYLAISDDWKWALGLELLDFTDPRNPRPAPNALSSGDSTSKRGGLALSPDGRLRVAGAGDRALRLWDNLTERPVGHAMPMSSAAPRASFSPDGRLVVVFEWTSTGGRAGRGMSLRLWETSTGLPCGPALTLRELTVELLFDREARWLAQKAPFDSAETLVIQLPDRDLPLAEMERQSWLLSGSRLDEAGNVEVIPDVEVLRLETALPNPEPATQPKEQPSPASEVVKPTKSHAAPPTLPDEIRSFIAAKEQQARSLAGLPNRELPPELGAYFQAALAGNWQPASNAFVDFNRRLEQGPFDESRSRLFTARQPVMETHIALEYFTRGQPKYASAFGRDIVASLPAGSIYFGGTDPGRGLVTAFAHSRAGADAIFVLTQNALADNSYLEYLRQMYGERIKVPTPQDSQNAFQTYMSDAQRRLEHDQQFPTEPKQIKPGEEIKIINSRVQVSGQVAVMSINALLARTIFENNAQREFYLQESFPLEWMYPHLEPHGLIMKLNRAPLAQISAEAVQRDQEFWTARMKPMVGDWLKEEATVAEVCDFIERVFVWKDLGQFKGDPAYLGDPYSTKMFSKLRSSMAGVYRWRADHAKNEAERQRMVRAADFAFRQALALGPNNPEVVFRYIRALTEDGRVADALRVARVAAKFPESEAQAARLIRDLESKKEGERQR